MKRGKLIVFAVFVSMVVGYAIYDFQSSQKQDQRQAEQRLIFKGDSEQIQKLSLVTGASEIELEKTVDGWRMLKPVRDLANSNLIEQFIDGIVTEKAQESAVEGDQIDFSVFGLDRPKGVITITLNSGASQRFAIGKVKNYQGDAYLRRDQENKVWIVSSTWFSKIEKTPLDFRDKRLMRKSNAGTEKVSFESGSNRFQILKKEGQWSIVGKPEWKLDQNKVREFISLLNTTEALEFIAEGDAQPSELKKWGFDQPAVRITVQTSNDPAVKPWVIDFAPGSDKIYRARTNDPSLVMKVSPTDFSKFQQTQTDQFRDRAEPFDFDRSKLRKITIKLGAETYHFDVDDAKAKDLMNQYGKLKVSQFNATGSQPLDQQIQFFGDGDKLLFNLQWGGLHDEPGAMGNNKVFWAKSSSFPNGFTVSEMDITLLNLSELQKKAGNP